MIANTTDRTLIIDKGHLSMAFLFFSKWQSGILLHFLCSEYFWKLNENVIEAILDLFFIFELVAETAKKALKSF